MARGAFCPVRNPLAGDAFRGTCFNWGGCMNPRVVLAGGNGFIGRFLGEDLTAKDYEVVVLTRSPRESARPIRQVFWDGRTRGDWVAELDGAQAVINLAGRSVNCRYNARNRKEIFESRVGSTRVLGEA